MVKKQIITKKNYSKINRKSKNVTAIVKKKQTFIKGLE